jgi:small nuclear ribonucleoprotein (snRNP)-like protein
MASNEDATAPLEAAGEKKALPRPMDNAQASFWLSQFIGKNLRIHTSDNRVFGGQMKCTDKVSGILSIRMKKTYDGTSEALIQPWGGTRFMLSHLNFEKN